MLPHVVNQLGQVAAVWLPPGLAPLGALQGHVANARTHPKLGHLLVGQLCHLLQVVLGTWDRTRAPSPPHTRPVPPGTSCHAPSPVVTFLKEMASAARPPRVMHIRSNN